MRIGDLSLYMISLGHSMLLELYHDRSARLIYTIM